MGYFGSIRIVSSRTTKRGDNYEKVELESEVFFQPGEVPFNIEGIQESFVSVTERVKNMIENKILGWTTGPQLPTDFKPAAEIAKTEETKIPSYDSNLGRWNHCEKHPNAQIVWPRKDGKGSYYACKECQEFLQKDGSRKPMGLKE
jgi:hypothetical protein